MPAKNWRARLLLGAGLPLLAVVALLGSCVYEKPAPKPTPPPIKSWPAPRAVPCPASEPPAPAPVRETWREFLFKGMSEDNAYRLKSYVLILEEPGSNPLEKERQLALWEAFSACLSQAPGKASPKEKQRNNITYWPLAISAGASLPPLTTTSAFPVEHYDYRRARDLKAHVPSLDGSGPFIICSPKTLKEYGGLPDRQKPQLLIIPLAKIDPKHYREVMAYFQSAARQPEAWNNGFNWKFFKIQCKSALSLYSGPVLYALKWVSDKFDLVPEVMAQGK